MKNICTHKRKRRKVASGSVEGVVEPRKFGNANAALDSHEADLFGDDDTLGSLDPQSAPDASGSGTTPVSEPLVPPMGQEEIGHEGPS